MSFSVENNEYREQELEKFKQELGIDEALIHEAIHRNIRMNLADVKRRIDRAIIEAAAKVEAKYRGKP
jgi:hypothetical protein